MTMTTTTPRQATGPNHWLRCSIALTTMVMMICVDPGHAFPLLSSSSSSRSRSKMKNSGTGGSCFLPNHSHTHHQKITSAAVAAAAAARFSPSSSLTLYAAISPQNSNNNNQADDSSPLLNNNNKANNNNNQGNDSTPTSTNTGGAGNGGIGGDNIFQAILRNLAQWSLEDYKWRMDVFKSNQADRMLEQSLARMRGQEYADYVRPMDAPSEKVALGPLGQWEKNTVEWLEQVMEEEGRRAEQIVQQAGQLVRPRDVVVASTTSTSSSSSKKSTLEESPSTPQQSQQPPAQLGPLGMLEQRAADFVQSIRNAEQERVRNNVLLRPKDAAVRGPLGDAEYQAVRVLQEIQESERLRMKQSRFRGGQVVRPMDVPGPLGEFEAKVLAVFDAEQRRARQKQKRSKTAAAANDDPNGLWNNILRPKDATMKGPLGEAEQQAYETLQQLSMAEQERLESIKRILKEKRPMESDQNSFLGTLETFIVGLVRAPIMLVSVMARVGELLSSQALPAEDQEILEQKQQQPQKKKKNKKKNKKKDDQKDTR